ncbi:hypothetical protein ABLT12_30080 [Pseudomonas aeruginosa]|uniref:hypothetical protein n=1 Tax=Pseudomonas aeruginosa TaxID=287 RepID=UPI0032B55B4A
MSEVKRFDVPSMRSLIHGEQAVMGHEVVLASDYDALAAKLTMAEDAAAKGDAARQQCGGMEMEIEELRAEAQALREEVAALRARVVVSPDFDNDVIIETFRRNGFQIELGASYSVKGQIAQLLNALEELARLNGKAVSEGLLRRLCEPLLSHADYVVARNELRALLSEQEGGKQ